jgi:capsule polysaccharide export protein KpsC/LpsZ
MNEVKFSGNHQQIMLGQPQVLNSGDVWMLGAPEALRPVLSVFFGTQAVIFPSIRHPDGSVNGRLPQALIQRLLNSGPDVVGLWTGISLTAEQKTAIEARGSRLVRMSPARLFGPVPDPGYLPQPYGIQFNPADKLLTDPGIVPETRKALFERYRTLLLSAVTEAGPVALPIQARQLLKTPCVMVVATENRGEAVDTSVIAGWADLLQDARRENPDRTITFITNGHPPPNPQVATEAKLLERIRTTADIICSERWNLAFLPLCLSLYTDSASAALDAWMADCRVSVRDPGPMLDLVEGHLAPEDALADQLLRDTLFVDPLHGRLIPQSLVLDVIAARRTLLPSSPLPTKLRWPMAAPREPQSNLVLGYLGTQASHTPIDTGKVLAAPLALIPPGWLPAHRHAPICPQDGLLMLQGDRECLRAIAADTPGLPPVVELIVHPDGDLGVLAEFAQYQPVLFLPLVRRLIRQSGARKALVCDIVSPAVRLFARACALEGVERAYLPMQIDLPPEAVSLPALCDTALAWHPVQKHALAELAHLPPSSLREIRLPAEPRGGTRTVIWLERTGMTLAQLKVVIAEVLALAELMDLSLLFVLGPDALAHFDQKTLELITLNPRTSHEVLGLDPDLPEAILSQAGLVLTQNRRIRALADQQGCPWQPMLISGSVTDKKAQNKLRTHIRSALLNWCDQEQDPDRPNDHTGMGSKELKEALGAWLETEVMQRKTRFELENIGLAVTSVPRMSLLNEARFLFPMLSIQKGATFGSRFEEHAFIDVEVLFVWGPRLDARKRSAIAAAQLLGVPVVYLEDGFIRSVEIGLMQTPTLSVCFDSKTPFFDATKPSQLEDYINAATILNEAESTRVRNLINRITEEKISKYNFAPYKAIKRLDPSRPAILVVDQRAGDVSIEMGLATEATFIQMVDKALDFINTHDVIIKTHPDANIGGKESAIGAETLARAAQIPGVMLITEDMNPYSLIDIAEKIFVVSSGMGFEALLAGKEVWCFGAPFYAGWGLTIDQLTIPRRVARPSLEEVFHAFYIVHTRYYSPVSSARGEIEDVIEFILSRRPWSMPSESKPEAIQANNKDGLVLSNRGNPSVVWAFGIHDWKTNMLERLLPHAAFTFCNSIFNIDEAIINEHHAAIVWSYLDRPGLRSFCKRNKLKILRMEDGFLRSVGLGSDHILPYSLCIDSRGIYFDARSPSDLEHLLQTHDFAGDPELLDRAQRVRERLIEAGLSKYNFPLPRHSAPYGDKTRRRVLVIGQVEDDASIRFGAPSPITNNDLVRIARQENPDAQVIYRIHPDVLEGKRPELSDPAEVADICEISADRLVLADAFDGVDQVYTITSLAGFEALMRGINVTTVGMPFYAGWGLTDDRAACSRRTRRLTLDEVFAGAYLLYPYYFDPVSGSRLEVEQVIDALQRELQVLSLSAL